MRDAILVPTALAFAYLGIETASRYDSLWSEAFAAAACTAFWFVGIRATVRQISTFKSMGKGTAKAVNIAARQARENIQNRPR